MTITIRQVSGPLTRFQFKSAHRLSDQAATSTWFTWFEDFLSTSRISQPYLRETPHCSWIIKNNRQVLGRVMAMCPAESNGIGRFGFYNCTDDIQIVRLLTGSMEDWFRLHGMNQIIGPFHPSIHEAAGFLEQAQTPIQYGYPEGPKHLPDNLIACGYSLGKRLITYRQADPCSAFELERRLAPLLKTARDNEINLQIASWSEFKKHQRWLERLINECWKDNWGFEPISSKAARQLLIRILTFLPAGSLCFVERNGEPLGISLGVPDARYIAEHLPGWLGLLNIPQLVLKMRKGKSSYLRIALLGTVSSIRGTPMSLVVTLSMLRHLIRLGIGWGCTLADMGWILEDNEMMLRLLNLYGGAHVMTHVVMSKDL